MPLAREARLLWRKWVRGLAEQAEHDAGLWLRVREGARERLGIELEGLDVLDLGCGQLYPYSLLASARNRVTAIDAAVIPTGSSPGGLARLARAEGPARAAKTAVRRALFDRRYRAVLLRSAGVEAPGEPEIRRMRAESLELGDGTFDFVVSVAVLEHVEDVEGALREVHRVLRPGGGLGMVINLWTGISGGHNAFERSLEVGGVPPWDHLCEGTHPPNAPLNRMRLGEYRTVFGEVFETVEMVEPERHDARELLTGELRAELGDYEEHELLVDALWVFARK